MKQLPHMVRIRQVFDDDRIADPRGAAQEAAAGLLEGAAVSRGQTVAITGSSRGIANIAEIIAGAVAALKDAGLDPFIVPAMGSHGGGTAERQAAVLHHYGVTEEAVGAPVRSSTDTVTLCHTPEGIPVVLDRLAAEADHILLVNRIKPHTHLTGPIESGLAKILVIGLGKPAGALTYHRAFMQHGFNEVFHAAVPLVLEHTSVLGGLGIIENALDHTARIVPVRANEILAREPELLREATERMAKLPLDNIHVLVVDQIGKDVSGAGMDTNVIGRDRPGPHIEVIFVRDLTPASEGNAIGIGLADVTVGRFTDKTDADATFLNCATCMHLELARMPYAFETDREALAGAISGTTVAEPRDARIVWIRSTLALTELEVSEPLLPELAGRADIELLGEPHPFAFHPSGALVDAFSPPLA